MLGVTFGSGFFFAASSSGAGGPPAKPSPKTGQQSYGDIDHWFEKLIEAVKLVPAYKPGPGSNIEVVQLTALLTDYRQANKDVATTGAA